MLVIGSSDTGGGSLNDPAEAFPVLVGRDLGIALKQTVDVVNLPVVHVGPKAVPRVESALERENPDLVIFAFGAYHFIVGTVGQRVRRRYGERVYKLFRSLELRFEGKTENKDGRPARLNGTGRWLARRIIGAEPLSTQEEVSGIQTEILRLLSQREGTTVVILMAPPLADAVDRENKDANKRLAAHREDMTRIAEGYHFLVADCLPGFAAAEHSEGALRHSDGVHKGAAGHVIQAEALMQTLLSAPSPYAQLPEAGELVATAR